MAAGRVSEAERRLGLPPGAFPFQSRFLDVGGARLHFVDEGAGPLLFMIHGNPSWSYLYRSVILALRGDFRCVALDLPGFGLSTPPPGFSFLPEDHARLTAGLVEALDLRQATLVANDWGGPIGLAAMRETGGRITRLCLGNTFAWPVNGDFHFEWFSKLLGGPIGGFLAERYNVYINVIVPTSMKRGKISPEDLDALRAPFRGLQSPRAMQVLPWAITGSREWLKGLETFAAGFSGPAHFLWPDNDIAFREKELAHWRRLLPQATVTRIPNCGHLMWMDAPGDCAEGLRALKP